MLISHTHWFLFVHLGKTAGSSVQTALQPFADEFPKDRWSRLKSRLGWVSDYTRVYFPVHAGCNYIRKRLPEEVYARMFKFAFVRNPWDMLVSSYSYIFGNPKHHRNKRVKALGSFEAFVEYESTRNKFHQHSFITDEKGTFLVDFVGRFEALHSEFAAICRRIGVEAELPHDNRSDHRPYMAHYNQALRDHVAACWARDIDLFGYTFEGCNAEHKLPGHE